MPGIDRREQAQEKSDVRQQLSSARVFNGDPAFDLIDGFTHYTLPRLEACDMNPDCAAFGRQPGQAQLSLLMSFINLLKLSVSVLKGLKYLRVKMSRHCPAVSLGYNPEGCFVVKGRLIHPLVSQGIILVCDI